MIYIIHWQQGKAEGTIEHDGWPTQAIARREAKKVLRDAYGLKKAKITEIEVYGGKR